VPLVMVRLHRRVPYALWNRTHHGVLSCATALVVHATVYVRWLLQLT
jgi:hypothetical protein